MSAEPAKINGHDIIADFHRTDADNARIQRTALCCARLPGSGWCLREDGHDGEHAGIASKPADAEKGQLPLLQSTKGLRKK